MVTDDWESFKLDNLESEVVKTMSYVESKSYFWQGLYVVRRQSSDSTHPVQVSFKVVGGFTLPFATFLPYKSYKKILSTPSFGGEVKSS